MNYSIRHALPQDLPRIEEIYAYARQFMQDSGNPDQWGTQHPPHDQLVSDIAQSSLYVITERTTIHGVFYFYIGEDPTYSQIWNGNWRSDTPYGTIHRIAGDGSGGILKHAVAFALSQIPHLRIDTHRQNLVMQKALSKQGFQQRGIIYIEDGSERIAYDKLA
jgi:hypothetical protein